MDEKFMTRALSLAKKGQGKTKTNPMVGAVLVKDGRILSEGYHHGFGEEHAEVNCLKALKGDAKGATLYVNLEPCSHYGKTPPCVKAIVEAQIARVVIGTLDPNPKVAGRGAKILKEAGIDVAVGVLEEESLALNRPFFVSMTHKRPYITAKYATTLDGKIATKTGESQWITGEVARAHSHRLRGVVDGIMVGTGTVLADNPRLSNRSGIGENPSRVILDRRGVIDLDKHIYDTTQETIVYTAEMSAKKEAALKNRGVLVLRMTQVDEQLPIQEVLRDLYENRHIGHLLVEGGGRLHGSFVDEDLVDEFVLYLAPTLFGAGKGVVLGEGIDSLKERRDFDIKEVKLLDTDLYIRGVRRCLQGL